MLINLALIIGTKQTGIRNRAASTADHANASHRGPSTRKCRYAKYANMQISSSEKHTCKGMGSQRSKMKRKSQAAAGKEKNEKKRYRNR